MAKQKGGDAPAADQAAPESETGAPETTPEPTETSTEHAAPPVDDEPEPFKTGAPETTPEERAAQREADHKPVKVRNKGTVDWHGTDFKPVGTGHIPGGSTGTVTAKKAKQLIDDYGPEGINGRGPFELVEE